MDHNQQGGQPRRHFHRDRGRRGSDRRGTERRSPNTPPEQPHRGGDHVDVEQIMRDIRARISQRHGIELSNQQIQELAARRLEAILDPRTVKPGLLDQLRKSAGVPVHPDVAPAAAPPYTFEDDTLFETHRGVLRFIRSLLKPILRLFFNPNPLIHALHTQARLNTELAARELERERRQAEWNALHYELLQRVVTEASRITLEMQALGQRVESLGAKVDFNERRVRAIEGSTHQPQPQQRAPRNIDRERPADRPVDRAVDRPVDRTAPRTVDAPTTAAPPAPPEAAATAVVEGISVSATEAPRRRRRRRRGRRGASGAGEATATTVGATAAELDGDLDDGNDGDEEAADVRTDEIVAETDPLPADTSIVSAGSASEPSTDPAPAVDPEQATSATVASATPAPPSRPLPDEPAEG